MNLKSIFIFVALLASSTSFAIGISPTQLGFNSADQAQLITGTYNPEIDGSFEDLMHDAYIYQVRRSRYVNWMYIGYAPRVEDASRIRVVMSKRAKTMRVSLQLTKAELSAYPEYLSRKAGEVEEIVFTRRVQFFQSQRVEDYISESNRIRRRYNTNGSYSNRKAEQGLQLMRDKFPTNVFEYANFDSKGPNEIAAIAHFVYPITVHSSGTWPEARDYRMSVAYDSIDSAVQERRSVYTKGTGTRVSDVFGGFPAFWVDYRGAGTGVHGPIRYSSVDETNNRSGQRGPYGPARNQMWRFWQENEFLRDNSSQGFNQNNVAHRWDVVRTNQSKGCFRAETMELRHLLPSDRNEIFRGIVWRVIDQVDRVQTPSGEKFVDVNYYMLNPYAFPVSRREWIQRELGTDPQAFIEQSWLFNYLQPATVEFYTDGGAEPEVMGELNRAGGQISL